MAALTVCITLLCPKHTCTHSKEMTLDNRLSQTCTIAADNHYKVTHPKHMYAYLEETGKVVNSHGISRFSSTQ